MPKKRTHANYLGPRAYATAAYRLRAFLARLMEEPLDRVYIYLWKMRGVGPRVSEIGVADATGGSCWMRVDAMQSDAAKLFLACESYLLDSDDPDERSYAEEAIRRFFRG